MRSVALLAVLCVGASGCATLVNRGSVRSGPVAGGTARLELRHAYGRVEVFEGGNLLTLREGTGDHAWWDRQCRLLSTDPSDCNGAIYFPYVELSRGAPHQLRLVRKGREAVVTVSASTHWAWLWANGVWLAAAPVGWVVDLTSGRMKYFGSLDVDRAFRNSGTATN
jgi:hypothetical protein